MYSSARLCKTGIIIVCLMIIIGLSQITFAQGSYELEIKVDDVIACQGQTGVEIPIYLKNYTDSITAFSLWLQVDRPDIMEFQTSPQTIEYDVYYIYTDWYDCEKKRCKDSVIASPYWVCLDWNWPDCLDSALMLGYYRCTDFSGDECIDSVFEEWIEGEDPVYTEIHEATAGSFDTVGTLIQGWEMVTTRSLTETGYDILITAFADQSGPLPDTITPGIGFPQVGEIPLIKLLANVFPLDENVIDRTVTILVEYNIPSLFAFSNELGESQCLITEEVEKYEYLMCMQWLIPDELCIYWSQVHEYECPPEGCDSIAVDTILHGYLDVDRCCDPDGENCITGIEESECSDQFGGEGTWFEGCISIADGSLYVKNCICGDFDGDGMFNILDIIFLVNHIYKKGPAPEPIILADTDGDGRISILDIVCLISAKYKFGNCCDDPSWFK